MKSFSQESLYLAGATASGKSAVAIVLGEQLGGEIISVDSMQVYRGMDIGTAKPTAEDRARVPHHLIDVVDLNEGFDAARFVRLAREAEKEIRGRNKLPIFSGGTGLYFNALLGGLVDTPRRDEGLRRTLESMPLDELLSELKKKDCVTYERIDRGNARRVIRAVEVIRLTGRALDESRAQWSKIQAGKRFGLVREREDLHRRINARVDQMFAAGLIEETRRLMASGLELNRTAMQALGYRQVVEHLRGEQDLDETIELVKIKTRQFAKRQMTWFKRQLDLEWITVSPDESSGRTAQRIVRAIEGD